MKMKSIVAICGMMMAALILVAPMSAFAQQSAVVNVVKTLQSTNNLLITATEVGGAFTNSTFVIPNTNSQKNAMLAILLTAKSTTAPAEIFFNPANNIINAVAVSE